MVLPVLLSRTSALMAALTLLAPTQSMPTANQDAANMADAWTGGTSETKPSPLPENVDVVIVGAGFSGLQTAYDLHRAGLSCVVLEANPRVGGRSYSYALNSLAGIVELGATWINKDTQPDVYALTQEFGIDVVPQDGKGDVLWQNREGQIWRAGKDDPIVVSLQSTRIS